MAVIAMPVAELIFETRAGAQLGKRLHIAIEAE